MADAEPRYVSRGGVKLAAALDGFGVDPAGMTCADLGSHVGGFVDCLLQRGAARVYAVDTGYGTLDWRLRKDERVVVLERTNAMHVQLPEPVDLVTVDAGWTRQRHILPSAARMLGANGQILSLLKPHYEAPREWLRKGVLDPEHVTDIAERIVGQLPRYGVRLLGHMESPLAGHAGNHERWLWLVGAENAS